MYKQNPKSPVLKALKGDQGKLPQHLQDAIKAAPESPAKQTKSMQKIKRTPETPGEKKAAQRAAQTRISSDSTYTYNALRNDPNSWMSKPGMGARDAAAEKAGRIARKNEAKRSPAKQTTAGEFAHQQYEMDKKTGKATRDIDKVKSVFDALTTDKTYPEAKKEYRKKQKEKYNKKSNVEKIITRATSRQNSHKK